MDDVEQEELAPAPSVGEQLRTAREAKKMSIEDLAAQTRIPMRHLVSLENSEWDKLPAPTYTMGFAKNYASAVGLDRAAIADELRVEMGGVRANTSFQPETFEPADPKRVMPKGLVIGALAALALVAILLGWLANRDPSSDAPAPVVNEAVAVAPAPPPIAANQVTITADQAAWVEIKDGATILKQSEMAQGESFAVPSSAIAPMLSTAKPEALRIAIGTSPAPAIGKPGAKVSDVRLLPADLLRGPAEPVAVATPTPAPAPRTTTRRPAPRTAPRAAVTPPPPPVVTTTPATTNTAN